MTDTATKLQSKIDKLNLQEKELLQDEIKELKADLASADRTIELLNNRIDRMRNKYGLNGSTSPTPTINQPKKEEIDFIKVLQFMQKSGKYSPEEIQEQKKIWMH